MATVANWREGPRLIPWERGPGGSRIETVVSRAMPKLLFVTVPTDEVLNKEGKVRFPGSEAAVEKLKEAGWEIDVCDPTWPKPLEAAKEGSYDAVLVSTYKAVPRSRDAASMLSRMHDVPVYTVGVLQKDDAFRTMAPTVGVLKGIGELPLP